MSLIYLDTETTGLDPERHEIWEIAYAVDDGPIIAGTVHHSLRNAHPDALRINHYAARHGGESLDESALLEAIQGATLVGANPAFDASFLRARWGQSPWRYRLLDIEAYALPYLRVSEPRGLKDIAGWLSKDYPEVPIPDHTAAGDVDTLRECHRSLMDIYEVTS